MVFFRSQFLLNLVPVSVERVLLIQQMNKEGKKPDQLQDVRFQQKEDAASLSFENVVGQDSLTRFDMKNNRKKKKRKKNRNKNPKNNNR